MENENKNSPADTQKSHQQENHKPNNRNQRHKSYFIQPAGEKQKGAQTQSAATEVKTPDAAKASATRKPNNSYPHKNHKNHKKSAEAPYNNDANQQNTVSGQKQGAELQKSEAAEQSQSKNVRNKNHHRRNHDKRRDEQKSPLSEPQKNGTVSEKSADVLNSEIKLMPTKKSDRLQKPEPKKLSKFSDSPEYEKYSDYEEFSVNELYGEANVCATEEKEENPDEEQNVNEPEIEVVGIRFKSSGKTYYFEPNGIEFKVGSRAIVETARGLEYGEVAIANTMVKESNTVPPLRPVIRKATEADVKHHAENKEKEEEAFKVCNEKIIAHKLDMKLIDAQYTFDNTKLLFYFTSSGRVDFRDLVKDLASVFRTRIELRQIGIRDEAKMVGGLGLCGRSLCCSLFLTDFGQVSIKMAKEQNLSLNSSKISGICGRLMCCLRYEHDTYEYEIKRTPPVDSLVRTVDGIGVVTEISPLAATIKVKLNSSPDTPPKSYKRDEVTVLKKKQDNQ